MRLCVTTLSAMMVAVCAPAWAQDEELAPAGQFVTITSPITDAQVGRVGNVALELQAKADREGRKAVLVLEIPPGTSRMGQVSDLARRLTSSDLSGTRVIAWLPETVTGNHAIIALACNEIIMDPDASLGDIGRGQTVADVDQQLIHALTARRNFRVQRGVIQAMMDPKTELRRVLVQRPGQSPNYEFMTTADMRNLPDDLIRTETETINEVGQIGLFKAHEADKLGFLVTAMATSRSEVATLYKLPVQAMREKSKARDGLKAAVIEMHEAIEERTEAFLIRNIREAMKSGCEVIVFDIDSPGGLAEVSFSLADHIRELDPEKVTTVAWVRHDAISGAAVIALGMDHIILHPEAIIGDVGVIELVGQHIQFAGEKAESKYLQNMKLLAQSGNRSTALVQSMMDKDLPVFKATNLATGKVAYMSQLEIDNSNEEWERGPMVPESSGLFLTLTGDRAHELGIADAPANDIDEVMQRFGVDESSTIQKAKRTWVDGVVHWLTSGFGTFSLIALALLCAYVEAHLPGGFFGICSAGFFGLFFWSRCTNGTAGALEVIMFILGLILLALELFVIPGFGIFGISGLLLIGASLVMASSTFSGMTTGQQFDTTMKSLANITGAVIAVVMVAVCINRFLPSIPILNRLVLTPPGQIMDDGVMLNPSVTGGQEVSQHGILVGQTGQAESTLRPAGKASFGDLFIDVVSDGGFIEPGTPVVVTRVAGNRVVVTPNADA